MLFHQSLLALLLLPFIESRRLRGDSSSDPNPRDLQAQYNSWGGSWGKKTKKGGNSKNDKLKLSKKYGTGSGTVSNGSGWVDDRGGSTAATELVETKPCVTWDDAVVMTNPIYLGDYECRVESGRMESTGSCCRIYPFNDQLGQQIYLQYDNENIYPNLACVCNENTAIVMPGDRTDDDEDFDGGGIIDIGSTGCSVIEGWVDDTNTDCSWYEANDVAGCPNWGWYPGSKGTAADACCHCQCETNLNWVDKSGYGCSWYEQFEEPGCPLWGNFPSDNGVTAAEACCHCSGYEEENPVCTQDNLSPNQQKIMETLNLESCETASDCPGSTCCYSPYCVCWPLDHLAGGLSNEGCF